MLNNSYYNEILRKHLHQDLVVDTNLLVVYCIGNFCESLVGKIGVTESYTIDEYRVLKKVFRHYRIVTLPNILSELTDLVNLNDRRLKGFAEFLRNFIDLTTELLVASNVASVDQSFIRLGLTDSAIIHIAKENRLVISADLDLCLYLESLHIDVINYNNIKGDLLLS